VRYGFEVNYRQILTNLVVLAKSPIIIGDSATFRFEGHKTSILTFLLDRPADLFSSHTPHLYLRGGSQLKNPGDVVGSKLGGLVTAGGGEGLASIGVDLAHTGIEYAAKAVGAVAGEIKKPGNAASFFDKWLGEDIIVTLTAMSPPQTYKYDKVYTLNQSVTFSTLAGYISEHF
jgi:hypothetical protein